MDIVERLRNTPNWKREAFEHWKSCRTFYDRAPFEAADEITRLRAEVERLREALETIKRTIEARSELFISDSACLFNLHDRARAALQEKRDG